MGGMGDDRRPAIDVAAVPYKSLISREGQTDVLHQGIVSELLVLFLTRLW